MLQRDGLADHPDTTPKDANNGVRYRRSCPFWSSIGRFDPRDHGDPLRQLASDRHQLAVKRDDGSTDEIELDTRSFLHHDLAHLAIKAELGLTRAFCGSVAGGAVLAGVGLERDEVVTAERLAGPLQH